MSESETRPVGPEPAAAIRERLLECARLLRSTRHLDPEAQAAVAEVLAELATSVDLSDPDVPAEELAESSAHLARALQAPHDEGLLTSARHRFEEVAARAEAEAPVTAGVVRRLVDALSGIGI